MLWESGETLDHDLQISPDSRSGCSPSLEQLTETIILHHRYYLPRDRPDGAGGIRGSGHPELIEMMD